MSRITVCAWVAFSAKSKGERVWGRKADLSPRLVVWHLSRITVCAWVAFSAKSKGERVGG